MTEVREVGRQLVVTFGDDEGREVFTFKPANVATGRRIADAYFIAMTNPDVQESAAQSEELLRDVIGDEFDHMQELRPDEADTLFHAVFLWQVQGGGIGLAKVAGEDHPKALHAWLETMAGVFQRVASLLPTSLPTESENPTP